MTYLIFKTNMQNLDAAINFIVLELKYLVYFILYKIHHSEPINTFFIFWGDYSLSYMIRDSLFL